LPHPVKRSISNLFHLGSVQATNVLLQLILIPLVLKRVGLEANGYVLISLSLSGFISILLNYASNQTGPIDVKLSIGDILTAEKTLAPLFGIRFIFFVLYLGVAIGSYLLHFSFSVFLLGISALVFSEVINPYIYFLGLEQLKYYNLANLFSRVISFFLIFHFILDPSYAPFVNSLVGISQLLGFGFLWVYLFKTKKITKGVFSFRGTAYAFRKNFPLTVSNLAVHLQQSVYLYGLGFMGNPVVLGAYAIADKIIWGIRMLLIAFSNSIYPIAIEIHHRSYEEWLGFRRKVNKFLFFMLFGLGILIFLFAPLIAFWLSNSSDEKLVITFIRWISIVPLIIGLNALNVMEILMDKTFSIQLRLSISIFIISIVLTLVCLILLPLNFAIIYLLLIESICLVFYEKNRRHIS
jgi:O-antigen/teichoic acid export membrane protein